MGLNGRMGRLRQMPQKGPSRPSIRHAALRLVAIASNVCRSSLSASRANSNSSELTCMLNRSRTNARRSSGGMASSSTD